MPHDTFLYFAYGSNVLTRRLTARTPSARVHSIGFMLGRCLTFSKASQDGSGKCHMDPTKAETDRTEGVVFAIAQREKPLLDRAEGLGQGYKELLVDITTPDGLQQALAYVASADAIDRRRDPYHWYKALVIAGAVEHGLSATHVERLWAVPSVRDPNPDRPEKRAAEAVLEGTGSVLEWYQRLATDDDARSPKPEKTLESTRLSTD